MYKVKKGRTLADALREAARSIELNADARNVTMRHDRNAYRIIRRLALAEARRLEDATLPSRVRRRKIVSMAERARIDGTALPVVG
jgi:hypothetical protein